jgi:hypothetical protein
MQLGRLVFVPLFGPGKLQLFSQPQQKEATLSAVILPFEQSRTVKGHFIDREESNVIK